MNEDKITWIDNLKAQWKKLALVFLFIAVMVIYIIYINSLEPAGGISNKELEEMINRIANEVNNQ